MDLTAALLIRMTIIISKSLNLGKFDIYDLKKKLEFNPTLRMIIYEIVYDFNLYIFNKLKNNFQVRKESPKDIFLIH